MKALAVALLTISCARQFPAQPPVVVYRTAYVQPFGPRIPGPVYFGGPSVSLITVPPPPPDPDHASEVYGYSAISYGGPIYAPTPRTAVVVVKDLPPSQRKHDRWHYDRAVQRCDGRATKWARERCYRREAQ